MESLENWQKNEAAEGNLEEHKESLLERLRRTKKVLQALLLLTPALQAAAGETSPEASIAQIDELAATVESGAEAVISYEEKLQDLGFTAEDNEDLVFSVISEQDLGGSISPEDFQKSQDVFTDLLTEQSDINLVMRDSNSLQSIYGELELHASNIMDPETRPELGEFLPVDYYIVTHEDGNALVNIHTGDLEQFSFDDTEALHQRVSDIRANHTIEHE